MPRYSPTTEGLTPHGRVGAGATSKVLLAANDAREEVILSVDHETAKVYLALGETAVLGQGPFLREKDPYLRLLTKSAISVITETAGPNEKQKITLTGATAGTFTLSFGGKTTEALQAGRNEVQTVTLTGATGGTFKLKFGAKETAGIAFNATAEAVQTALEGLETIGAGNVKVTGGAGGPYTVEFVGGLARKDVEELVANGEGLEGEGAEVKVATKTPGVAAATKEKVQEALEALTTIGEKNVKVEGEAGVSYTVEFIEALKATDVAQMTADGSKLEPEGGASVSVETTVPGGVSVVFAEV